MIMARRFSRRRAIAIFAATAGLPLIPNARAAAGPVTWEGQALGAPARLILNHEDRAGAARLIGRATAEIARLEQIFSLYREDSALSALNNQGFLLAPPTEFIALLERCREFWELSDGTFDPSVQPLWALYRDHFSSPGADPSGPPAERIAKALAPVGFDRVKFNRDRIAMPASGALTLNGIAQGFITDRIVDMLEEAGMRNSFVDMGEARAMGSKEDGGPWRVGLAVSEDSDQPDAVLPIVDKAVATSSATGFVFDEAGRFGHILDPRKGHIPISYKRLSVIAADATTADALSTAFSLHDIDNIRAIASAQTDLSIDILTSDGEQLRFGAVL